jgi:acyl dehydratase
MADTVRLNFDTLPTLGSGYRRALFSRKRGLRVGDTLGRFEATIPAVTLDATRMAAYREVCGFAPGTGVPLTYPHILAAPLHLAVLTCPQFPVAAMGIIHARNTIVQHKSLAAGDSLAIQVLVDGHRDVRNGFEFDVVTKASLSGELAWESVTVVFVRRKAPEGAPKAAHEKAADPAPMADTKPWSIADDTGRRYAKVSGDYNPIHLWPITAKLLGGFPRPICHGMWSLAHCVGELEGRAPAPVARLEVEFKRPVLMPTKAIFGATPIDDGFAYDLRDKDGKKQYLTGTWTVK